MKYSFTSRLLGAASDPPGCATETTTAVMDQMRSRRTVMLSPAPMGTSSARPTPTTASQTPGSVMGTMTAGTTPMRARTVSAGPLNSSALQRR